MLYADKAALANRARLRMLQIRERELGLYTRNSRVIATQSALLCGVAYSGLLCAARMAASTATGTLRYKPRRCLLTPPLSFNTHFAPTTATPSRPTI